jgi:hypothetical protein
VLWPLLSKVLYRAKVKPFLKILQDPTTSQDRRLQELLRFAAGTTYGKRHSFGEIVNYEQFVERVPVNQYKDLQPYIDRELKGTSNVLYPEPIKAVIATSGSTGKPKLVPYISSFLKDVNTFTLRLYTMAAHLRPILNGKMLAMVAPAVYKQIGNWQVGYLTGYAVKHANPLLSRKVVPRPDVFDITDWEAKFHETIRQSVETPNITVCVGITSFVIALLRRTKYDACSWLLKECRLSSQAKRRVEAALASDGTLDLNALWPELSVIIQTGVVRDLYEPIIRDLVGDVLIHESYASTESCYGSQLNEDMRGVIPAVDLTVFEFAEMRQGPLAPDVETIPLSDVKINTPYRIVASSRSMLWRYDVHDVVIFTSLDPPTMRCMGKSENVVNLSGEKVSEMDITSALAVACEEGDAVLRDFVVAPDVNVNGGTYHLFTEFARSPSNLIGFACTFDAALQERNRLYGEVRKAQTIGAPVIHPIVPGSFDTYERLRLQSEHCIVGQTKMPRVASLDQAVETLASLSPGAVH